MTRISTLLAVGAALCALTAPVQAQQFPNKPIRFVSAYAPGGGAEVGLRILALKLTEAGWPPIIVENKPGGGGALAANSVMQAAPDGYTILQCDVTPFSINKTLMKELSFEPLKDFAPITVTFSFPSVLVVPAQSQPKTAQELIALAKAKTGGVIYASQGIGSGGHLLGHMFSNSLKSPMVHVPYRGSGQAMPDVAAGRVDYIFASLGSIRNYLQNNTVRPLAVTSKKRMPELPDVPTMTELGYPDVFFDVWFGLCAPAATPAAIVKTIHDKVEQVIKQPDVVKRLAEAGLYVETNSPDEFRKMIAADTERLGKVIKDAGISPQ